MTPAPSAQAKTRKKIVETEKKTQASKSSDTVRTDTRSSSGSAAVPVVLWRLEPSCMMFSAMAWTSQCFPTGNPGDPAAQRKAAPREGGLRGRHFRLRESPCNLRVLETLTSVLFYLYPFFLRFLVMQPSPPARRRTRRPSSLHWPQLKGPSCHGPKLFHCLGPGISCQADGGGFLHVFGLTSLNTPHDEAVFGGLLVPVCQRINLCERRQ